MVGLKTPADEMVDGVEADVVVMPNDKPANGEGAEEEVVVAGLPTEGAGLMALGEKEKLLKVWLGLEVAAVGLLLKSVNCKMNVNLQPIIHVSKLQSKASKDVHVY